MTVASDQPHEFVGRHDRWCEVCNRPDRDPIHGKRTIADFNYTAAITDDLLSRRPIIRISYRRKGFHSAWSGFHLVPDEGETFESVAAKVEPAIVAHAQESGGEGPRP